jgi:hypothetical protein
VAGSTGDGDAADVGQLRRDAGARWRALAGLGTASASKEESTRREGELGQGTEKRRGSISFYREGEGEAPRGGTVGHHHAIDGHQWWSPLWGGNGEGEGGGGGFRCMGSRGDAGWFEQGCGSTSGRVAVAHEACCGHQAVAVRLGGGRRGLTGGPRLAVREGGRKGWRDSWLGPGGPKQPCD